MIAFLKSNAYNNKACHIWFHRLPRQFLPRDHGGFGHKNQKMSDYLGIAQKVRHFLILVPKTAIVSWQKWSNISMELAAPNVVLLLSADPTLFAKTALQQLHSNSFYLVEKFPLWRISVLADIRPMGYKLSCCGSIWSR